MKRASKMKEPDNDIEQFLTRRPTRPMKLSSLAKLIINRTSPVFRLLSSIPDSPPLAEVPNNTWKNTEDGVLQKQMENEKQEELAVLKEWARNNYIHDYKNLSWDELQRTKDLIDIRKTETTPCLMMPDYAKLEEN